MNVDIAVTEGEGATVHRVVGYTDDIAIRGEDERVGYQEADRAGRGVALLEISIYQEEEAHQAGQGVALQQSGIYQDEEVVVNEDGTVDRIGNDENEEDWQDDTSYYEMLRVVLVECRERIRRPATGNRQRDRDCMVMMMMMMMTGGVM